MSLRSFLVSILILGFASGFSQEQAGLDFLKRSAIAIHQAQKQMMVTGKTDVGGRLAKAVLLQAYAVKLFGEKKKREGVCSSLLARQITNEILKDVTGKEATFFLVTDDEKKQIGNCKDETTMLQEGKKELPHLSANDKDFIQPATLNASNIDPK